MAPRSVLAKFPQVDHHQASGKLAEVYDDIMGAGTSDRPAGRAGRGAGRGMGRGRLDGG